MNYLYMMSIGILLSINQRQHSRCKSISIVVIITKVYFEPSVYALSNYDHECTPELLCCSQS